MIKKLLLFSFTVFVLNIYSQNPYEEFGSDAPVIKSKQEILLERNKLVIYNSDSTAIAQAIQFDFSKNLVSFFDSKNKLISSKTISNRQLYRWLTTDPYRQYSSPYVGMGNDPVNGVDSDGGWKTKWGRFWGWVGNGFKGTNVNNPNASDANKRYGIRQSYTGEKGVGGNLDEIILHNSYSGADLAAFNNGFTDPVMAPQSFFGKVMTGYRTSPNGLSVDEYGYELDFKQHSAVMPDLIIGPGPKNPFKLAAAYRSAITLFKGGLTAAGKALSKHPNVLRLVTDKSIHTITTNAQRNHYSAEAIKYIIRNGAKSSKNGKEYGKVIKYIDYKLPSGLGVRFYENGNKLKGFLGRGL